MATEVFGAEDIMWTRQVRMQRRSLSTFKTREYEDYATDALDTDSYCAFLNDYQDENKQLSQRLKTIEDELHAKDEYTENLQKLEDVISSFLDVDKLTAPMLNQLIERIEVGYTQEVDGQQEQEVTIICRFIQSTL